MKAQPIFVPRESRWDCSRIWNLESWIWNLGSGIWDLGSGIWDLSNRSFSIGENVNSDSYPVSGLQQDLLRTPYTSRTYQKVVHGRFLSCLSAGCPEKNLLGNAHFTRYIESTCPYSVLITSERTAMY